eukprot:TRINITY_DN10969_c0_g1_i3.p1 TRINITY_DN10969_c0_g1~~TRINITY_DN10969_c0_g1_i3.p1  ORF type:complete len:105 (+),score=13.75 TRINITY_DN10969_c0_g1_i3:312-626(+)
MIHCFFASKIWAFFHNMFEVQWVMPQSVADLFCQWHLGGQVYAWENSVEIFLYATLWKLWMERNNRLFRNRSKSVEEVVESNVWSVSKWVSGEKEFWWCASRRY